MSGLTPGALYQVKVRAKYEPGKKSAWSEVVSGSSAPETGPDYGAERLEAVSLGDIADTEPTNVEGTIDDADGIDYFRFSLSAPREVGLRLRRLDFNADFYLEGNSGAVIASSENGGTAREVLNLDLDATGTGEFYFVRVEAKEGGQNNYTFRYLSTAPPATSEPIGQPVVVSPPVITTAGQAPGLEYAAQGSSDYVDLVSNSTGTTRYSTIGSAEGEAQQFTTGPSKSLLSTVHLKFNEMDTGNEEMTLSLRKSNASNRPGMSIANFVTPSIGTEAQQDLTFTLEPPVELSANTSYFIVLFGDDGGFGLGFADFYSDTSDHGWSIGNVSLNQGALETTWSERTLGWSIRMLLAGAVAGSTPLVSNTGQAKMIAYRADAEYEQAQGFTTGNIAGGYPLESIELSFIAAPSAGLVVTLHEESADDDDLPHSDVFARLTNPANLASGSGLKKFTPPADTSLETSTIYFVKITYASGSGAADWRQTQSNDEDPGRTDGWLIKDMQLSRNKTATPPEWTKDTGDKFLIKVNGPNYAATGTPIITGIPKVGQELTGSAATIADHGGLEIWPESGFGPAGGYIWGHQA